MSWGGWGVQGHMLPSSIFENIWALLPSTPGMVAPSNLHEAPCEVLHDVAVPVLGCFQKSPIVMCHGGLFGARLWEVGQ